MTSSYIGGDVFSDTFDDRCASGTDILLEAELDYCLAEGKGNCQTLKFVKLAFRCTSAAFQRLEIDARQLLHAWEFIFSDLIG